MIKLQLHENWQLCNIRQLDWIPAQIPGDIYAALLKTGKMPDPFFGDNEYQAKALMEEDYEYRTVFNYEEAQFKDCQEVILRFDGIDTIADIYLNGCCLGKVDNMHRIWEFPVGELLENGKNTLRVIIRSPLKFMAEAFKKYKNRGNEDTVEGFMHLRKAHYMCGWDWGACLPDGGIFRPVTLLGIETARLDSVYIRQVHKDGKVLLVPEVDVETVDEEESEADGYEGAQALEYQVTVTAPDGTKTIWDDCPDEIEIENPQLWWPNGLGEQPLYQVQVELKTGDKIVDTWCRKIGLRTLTMHVEKDQWGESFAHEVNGYQVFAMGADYIPEDNLLQRTSRERTRELLLQCKRANFNTVRVWGGGYYPEDWFFDLCDELGLMVWQDFMFACSVYELTPEFEANIRQEFIDNIKRLRHHASLALWCGNNEMESAWDHWPEVQSESKYLRADYIKMFEYVIPKAVRAADSETFFWQSSPSSGGCFDDPDDENRGDCHYWDVWHGQKPFTDYQKHYFRFCSEFGFQSFPCLKTVESFTEEKDRNIFSRVMENHQKNPAANGKILYYLSENFRYPENFRKLLYVSQILQGMAMKYGVDHWRRHRGRCMGTLYWQINDNWPVASWASIDYFGRWKALHYMAKKFYGPQAVSMCMDGDIMQVYLENESMDAQSYQVAFYVKNMECEILEKLTGTGTVGVQESAPILAVDVSGWEDKKYEIFLEAEVTLAGGDVLCDVETLVPYKYLELDKPEITAEVEEQGDAFVIHLKSSCFSPFTAIGFTDADVTLEDNFFHMTDGEEMCVRLDKKDIRNGEILDAADLTQQMEILTLA